MHSHGKFVFSNRSLEDENLRGKITDVAPDSKSRSGMLKDVHLVEAAFAADRIIISCDKTVEEAFAGASAIIHRLQEIIWVNPKIDTQSVLEWLRKGAKREKRRTLGFDADAPT